MRTVVLLLIATSCLPAQIVSGWRGQIRPDPAPQPGISRQARQVPGNFGRTRPFLPRGGFIGGGGFINGGSEVIVVQAEPKPEATAPKKPSIPADLVINPVWEKEKITPKLIEIP